jgi:hypothetical protein
VSKYAAVEHKPHCLCDRTGCRHTSPPSEESLASGGRLGEPCPSWLSFPSSLSETPARHPSGFTRYGPCVRPTRAVRYGPCVRASWRPKWPLCTGRAWPLCTGHPGPCVRAGILNLVLVHAGDRTASPPFMCAPSRALLVSKLRPVPSQEVLRREHRGAAIAPAGCRQFGKPPTRCLAFAINTKAAGLGHEDEAVMLKLTEPSRDAVAVSANFLLRVSLRQEEAAAHRTRLRAKPATP